LPAGPGLAAEAGIAFLDVADGAAAARMRPVVAAACDAADALGRADARMLLFAGESRLAAGRAADAAGILRRAAAEAPTSGPAALSLARAEHACGRDDKAREALRRARDLLGGTLPASAADLAHSLGL
jgi:Flp pilus assembly protein TadD